MRLEEMQRAIREAGWDGWLFFDHHGRDPLGYRILGLPGGMHVTRRWYYMVPGEGEPRGLVHRIEPGHLGSLPGEKRRYSSWRERDGAMEWLLGGAKRVGMQYSPGCAVPYVSLVDGGTLEAIRGYGVEVVSSGDLVQMFESRWDSGKLESHLEAGRRVDEIRRGAFELIREALASGRRVTECGVRDWILERFREEGLVTDHSPIVGVNEHAADPHYEPMEGTDREIGAGDVVLIDLWAKMRDAGSVYYDITWTGFGGTEVPEKVEEVFRVVTAARDAAVELAGRGGVGLRGFEVDDAARGVIERAGYGEWFVHRTGHSIGEEVHGSGANMDNLETHETRQVLEGTCFSVEPGIYLEGFGIRSEVNVFMGEGGGRVTGEIQRELVRLAG